METLPKKEDSTPKERATQWRAYTDGSYISCEKVAWAFVIVGQSHAESSGTLVTRHAKPMEDVPEELLKQRNVAAEMYAAMCAASWAKQKGVEVTICYDYEGVEKWVTGAWAARNAYSKKYRDYMRGHKHVAGFEHVKAHSGDKWNAMADRMARSAARDAT